MTLDDEIREVEEMVQAARARTTWHLERATKDLHLGRRGEELYREFLDATARNAEATLARCREIIASPALTADSVVPDHLAAVRESLRLMFAAAAVLEELARSAPHCGAAREIEPPSLRACSFCGRTEAEAKLVAGPGANICGSCTRLVCGVLGIVLSDESRDDTPRDDDAPSSTP